MWGRLAIWALAGALLAGCSEPVTTFIQPNWADTTLALGTITDAEGRVLEAEPHVLEPGEPMLLSGRSEAPFRVVVQSYALSEREAAELMACGVSFSGSGEPVAPPDAIWATPVLDPGTARAELVPANELPHFDVRRKCAAPAPTSCELVTVQIQTLPGRHNTPQLALLGDGSVLAMDLDTPQMLLGWLLRIDAEGNMAQLNVSVPDTCPHAVASDHKGLNLVSWPSGLVLRLDDQGAELGRWQLPERRSHELAIGEDGTIIAWNGHTVYELSASSSVAISRGDFPADELFTLAVVRRDRISAMTKRGYHFYDGESWQNERPLALAPGQQAIGDARAMAMVGNQGVFVRDEVTRQWLGLPQPVESLGGLARGGAFAPNGWLLVVGEQGLAALWDGKDWCTLNVASGGWLLDADVSNDARTAVAPSVYANVLAYLIRFDLSALAE